MEAKGKDKRWAEKEFDRRRTGATEWKCGTCPDTGLPTAQCYGDQAESDYEDKYNDDAVELSTQQKAASKKNVDDMLEDLGTETSIHGVTEALKKDKLNSELIKSKNDIKKNIPKICMDLSNHLYEKILGEKTESDPKEFEKVIKDL